LWREFESINNKNLTAVQKVSERFNCEDGKTLITAMILIKLVQAVGISILTWVQIATNYKLP
jgi:plasmid maintenance system antidote protein VapI